jgi:FkbM family methyltransferase
MSASFRLKYLFMSTRAVRSLLIHPLWTLRIAFKRAAFTVTRRFVGNTIISPEGDPVFNIQSLLNHWALFIIGEMGYQWQRELRNRVAPVVWDIGANIGQFGRLVKSINPGARIIAVEPWPGMLNYNSHCETFYPCAVGKDTGNARLTLCDFNGWTASTSNFFRSGKSFTVDSKPLDDLWQGGHVDLLKIDVDGAEFDVLAGATEMLEKTDMVIVEVTSPDTVGRLPDGFDWHTVNQVDWIGFKKPWFILKRMLISSMP